MNGLKVRCNVCMQAVPVGIEELVRNVDDQTGIAVGQVSRGRHAR